MKLKEIEALDDAALLAAFYWIAVRTTNEANSRRGLTKLSAQKEEWILAEIEKRFNVDFTESIRNK
jgi:hypothetical protein